MSDEHPNATTYRRTAEAFRTKDRDTFVTLVAPDVVWHIPGDHPMNGDVVGLDALIDWLETARDRGFWLSEHDVLANDDHVVALSEMGARRNGLAVQTRVVSVFHYRDGQQAERWLYPEDAAAWDAIFTV